MPIGNYRYRFCCRCASDAESIHPDQPVDQRQKSLLHTTIHHTTLVNSGYTYIVASLQDSPRCRTREAIPVPVSNPPLPVILHHSHQLLIVYIAVVLSGKSRVTGAF